MAQTIIRLETSSVDRVQHPFVSLPTTGEGDNRGWGHQTRIGLPTLTGGKPDNH